VSDKPLKNALRIEGVKDSLKRGNGRYLLFPIGTNIKLVKGGKRLGVRRRNRKLQVAKGWKRARGRGVEGQGTMGTDRRKLNFPSLPLEK